MSSTEQIILDRILDQQHKELAPDLEPSVYFEIFSAEQILKNYDLDYEEIESGLVDPEKKGHDGGIDSIYTFVNGILVPEEQSFEHLRQDVTIALFIIQSKNTPGFAEKTIDTLISTARDLLSLNAPDLSLLEGAYNSKVRDLTGRFRNTFRQLALSMPKLSIFFCYTTTGDKPHPNVVRKGDRLKEAVKQLYNQCECDVRFFGARELLSCYGKSKEETLQLKITDAMLGPTICLVQLKDYFDFITDNSELRRGLFEENIRDYEGRSKEVNESIRGTLETPEAEVDFWWLNNGITVVASEASRADKTLTLRGPKVVNGLQTSTEIFNHFKNRPDAEDNRLLLTRIVVTSDERYRNRIIIATNRQIAIPATSLLAFEDVQWKIEQYFKSHGLYYERRKNYYKNLGQPRNVIITIGYLAQAITAIVLQEPNNSRGRITSFLKQRKSEVFDDSYPIDLFLECVKFMRRIDAFLKSGERPEYVKGNEINVKYHLAMYASAIRANRSKPTVKYVAGGALDNIDAKFLKDCLQEVWRVFQSLLNKSEDQNPDQVSKSSAFDEALMKRLRRKFDRKSR